MFKNTFYFTMFLIVKFVKIILNLFKKPLKYIKSLTYNIISFLKYNSFSNWFLFLKQNFQIIKYFFYLPLKQKGRFLYNLFNTFIEVFDFNRFFTKATSFFALFIIFGVVISSLISIQASGKEGTCNRVYKELGTTNNVNTGTDVQNANSALSTTLGSGICNLMTVSYGVDPKMAEWYPNLFSEVPDEAKQGGLVFYSMEQVLKSADYMPQPNVVNHFAQNYLPKQMYEKTAFAAGGVKGGGDVSSANFYRQTGVEKLWTFFFNFSMVGYVLIIISAGFMIMFQSKMGQSSVTISSVISRIFVCLVLTLLSYEIAGLIMDLARVLVVVISYVIVPQAFGWSGPFYINGPLELFLVASTYSTLAGFGQVIGGFFANVSIWTLIPDIVNALMSCIGLLIFAAIIFYLSFKIYFKIVGCYVRLVVDMIFGPLYILMSAIPGKEGIVGTWLSRMFANSLGIVAIFFFVQLGIWFVTDGHIEFLWFTGGNMLGANTGATKNSIFGANISMIIGFTIYSMAAHGDDFVKEYITAKDSSAATAAVSSMLGAAAKTPVFGKTIGEWSK